MKKRLSLVGVIVGCIVAAAPFIEYSITKNNMEKPFKFEIYNVVDPNGKERRAAVVFSKVGASVFYEGMPNGQGFLSADKMSNNRDIGGRDFHSTGSNLVYKVAPGVAYTPNGKVEEVIIGGHKDDKESIYMDGNDSAIVRNSDESFFDVFFKSSTNSNVYDSTSIMQGKEKKIHVKQKREMINSWFRN